MNAAKKIAIIPGDGIGKDVIPEAVKAMQAVGAPVELTYFDWGADRYLRDGTAVPADGFVRWLAISTPYWWEPSATRV